ncbi:MAG TPA: Fic family protein, partial [Kofleriaceae bacterium]|nr:Fic family protein [Kofleriaceae bacterium]
MLRYKEKEDIEARYVEVDGAVSEWRAQSGEVSAELLSALSHKLLISLIFHDSALEGEVLTYGEINAAIDTNIISDATLIPAYEDIKGFHNACNRATEIATAKRKQAITIDTVREIYALLAPDEAEKGCPYRKENPLHRLYYHDIAPPEKISQQMRKLGEWMERADTVAMHPIERAARTHYKIMAVFPWAKQTGRTARIISNLILAQAGYPLAVIHSIDRQRYYEALRGSPKTLLSVYLEAVETTATSSLRVYEEAG